MDKLVIDRSKLIDKALYDPQTGCGCAVGQYLVACGVQPASLAGHGGVDDVDRFIGVVPPEARWLWSDDTADDYHERAWIPTDAANAIFETNDDAVNQVQERKAAEIEISNLFAEQCIIVEFIGEYSI